MCVGEVGTLQEQDVRLLYVVKKMSVIGVSFFF
jgi:hypothetical protein